MDTKELIGEYKSAYLAANGKPVTVEYSRGWFLIRSDEFGIPTRHRRKQIEAFRDELKRRVKSAA